MSAEWKSASLLAASTFNRYADVSSMNCDQSRHCAKTHQRDGSMQKPDLHSSFE
jgi:hypothetical protein